MDHSEKVRRQIHPRQNANIFSLIFFGYTCPLFVRGFRKELEDDDLYDVIGKCRSKKCADRLEHAYFSKVKIKEPGKKVSILRIIWNLYGLQYVALGLFHMTGKILFSTLEPEAVSQLVGYFKPGQTRMTIYDALYFAAMMIGLKAFHTIYFQNYVIYLNELALQIKVSFCSLIYRKALRLTPSALADTSLGNIVTVITKDVTQFEHSLNIFNDIWISIVQTIVICYLIYQRVGVSSVVGVLILLAVIPVQGYTSRIIRSFRLKMSKRTDERLQRMQETLSTIKTIKMYTWENVFAEKIGESRFKEMKILMKGAYFKIVLMISSSLVAKFAFYAIIMIYIWLHNDMSAEDIFYVMKIFNHLKHTIAMSFSFGFARLGELSASLKRINHILQLEELPEYIDKPDDEPQIDLRNISLKLNNRDILKNINLKFEVGLNVITGQLGCGKSSLIKVILRDYLLDGGEIRTRGRKSYASQDPWLFPSSIKQNILFGEKYDYKRYISVVQACALEYDFGVLENGDETIVADGGMNLSKGQQARINLARSIYKEADIYLIDDALTALDTKVQEHIFTHCIQGLLKNKCVILVTHNAKHIKLADNLVILHDGSVTFEGKQQNISEDILDSFESVPAYNDNEKEKEDQEESNEKEKLLIVKPEIRRRQIYHENKKSGSVDYHLYQKYFKYSGGFLIGSLLLSSYIGATFLESVSQKMLTNWINQKSNISHVKEKYIQNTTIDLEQFDLENTTTIFLNETFNVSTDIIQEIGRLEIQASQTMNLYTMSIIGYAVTELIKHYLVLKMGITASINIHKIMVTRALHAVMTFFDSFFIGNILNRFSQDLNVIDEHLIFVMTAFIGTLFHLVGVIGLIASVNWKFIIPAAGLALFSILVRTVYIKTSRSLKRLEAATRSPIVGHLNSTMEGLTTIRAYKAQDILKDEFDKHQDLYTSAFYTSLCIRGAFGFIMEISSLFFLVTVIARFFFFDTGINAGDAGLTLTQAGLLTMIIHFGLSTWSEVENNMTSFERVMEYTTIENENKTGLEMVDWPNRGEIIFKNVSLKYSNSNENILADVCFDVKPGNKIGIVGRTGAGKSTIISTLFRLYNYEGQIFIDGIELKTLALDFLRKHISIIPQDPIMFSGTIRSNIDPFGEFVDEDIWKALHKVHLDSSIPSLDTDITELNFSTGQRQLICLSRAIIRKNKIVVLDEATANMDPESEQIAQKIIEDNFLSCTLFIIAHRLDSILDCDKILVLDRGRVAEFDTPLNLLKNENGYFSGMLRNAGMHDVSSRITSLK
ncbi:unnamed protein product [Psylliodes chrysocephalus]|uniref:Uncharacterized protein n=1 Tax=Psylliodes chrysocephalus TaxID=3402493 RepID=A0A9P0CLV3_9CUCU|nr:unnamed protein product [Psylliodes chrysocephala]